MKRIFIALTLVALVNGAHANVIGSGLNRASAANDARAAHQSGINAANKNVHADRLKVGQAQHSRPSLRDKAQHLKQRFIGNNAKNTGITGGVNLHNVR